MTAPREDIVRKVAEWMACADESLRLAEYARGMAEQCPYRLVAFHAQQCAEMYLKAYLLHRGVEFPHSHNLSYLLELCEGRAPWVDEIRPAETLSPYAVTMRYPGQPLRVTAGEAETAVTIAQHVRETIRDAVAHAGVPA